MPSEPQQTDLNALRIKRDTPAVSSNGSSRQPKGRKGLWYAVAVIVVLALLFVFGRGLMSSPIQVQEGVVQNVFASQANSVLTASGYVVASRKAAVSSKGTGRLIFLGVEEGSHVKKGDVIGRLESADVDAILAETDASLGAAKATLENAQAALANADSSFRRATALYHQQIVASADLTAAEATYKQAQALVRTDEANVRLAERAMQAAQVQVEFTNIRAPFDGTVLTKDADVGDVMTPFGAAAGSRADIVTLADMNSLDAEVDVSETNLEQVRVDQPCEISVDAIPEKRYKGKVHMIVPTADRSKGTVLTKVDFLDRDERVLPEMSLKVIFLKDSSVASSSTPKLTVPASAVTTRNGKKVVFVISGDVVSETPVTLGEASGSGIAVISGLRDGQKVVLNPDEKLSTGTKVKTESE
ncbi:MAG TPA: efflux RND transporter periplasmic adaptor subunit [Candidatus Kapabacteria bacterium]|nr:efflux RND transporter periplasmic adaptor subunit [Candidatus Kapabacteria bacterium]